MFASVRCSHTFPDPTVSHRFYLPFAALARQRFPRVSVLLILIRREERYGRHKGGMPTPPRRPLVSRAVVAATAGGKDIQAFDSVLNRTTAITGRRQLDPIALNGITFHG